MITLKNLSVFDDGTDCVVACEVKHEAETQPRTLWFRTKIENRHLVANRYDGFVVSLITFAMGLGEDIKPDGPISPVLAQNLIRYQEIFCRWFPENFKPIKVVPNRYLPFNEAHRESASFFSGGVDSIYTLLKAKQENSDLSYSFFVHGCDIPIERTDIFEKKFAAYEKSLADCGVKLIGVRTNIREFVDVATDWGKAHGSALLGLSLVFGGYNKIYLASSYSTKTLHPWGSHPDTDCLLGVESSEVVHHGMENDRIGKTFYLADKELARKNLTVCSWLGDNNGDNCCRCSKCMRTMLTLELAGALDKFYAFSKPMTKKSLVLCPVIYEGGLIFLEEIIQRCKKSGRRDLYILLSINKLINYLPMQIASFLENRPWGRKIMRGVMIKKIFLRLTRT